MVFFKKQVGQWINKGQQDNEGMARNKEVILSKIWKTIRFSMTPPGRVKTNKSPVTKPKITHNEGNNGHIKSQVNSGSPSILARPP